MRASVILFGSILIGAVATGFIQRKSIWRLRTANHTLLEQKQEAQRLIGENEQLAALSAQVPDLDALHEANKDLPRLRNEVRQLREQKREFDRLRAENERLAAAIHATPTTPRRLAEMEGYVGKENWVAAGFATPEATLQTFFWAVAKRDFQEIAACMSSQMRANFEKELQGKSELERQKAIEGGIGQLAQIGGYQVSEVKRIADDHVVLSIRAAANGDSIKLPLRRIGGQWKLDEEVR